MLGDGSAFGLTTPLASSNLDDEFVEKCDTQRKTAKCASQSHRLKEQEEEETPNTLRSPWATK